MSPPNNRNVRLIPSMDLFRGMIMVIMCYDHTKDFFEMLPGDWRSDGSEMWSGPLKNYQHSKAEFFSRVVSHICAPGFFFTMGVGMALFTLNRMFPPNSQIGPNSNCSTAGSISTTGGSSTNSSNSTSGKTPWTGVQICTHYFVRGIVLILLGRFVNFCECLYIWVAVARHKNIPFPFPNVDPRLFSFIGIWQVLAGLGFCMIIGGFLISGTLYICQNSRRKLLFYATPSLILFAIAVHMFCAYLVIRFQGVDVKNGFDSGVFPSSTVTTNGFLEILIRFLFLPGKFSEGFIAYSAIPFLGVALFGMGMGLIFHCMHDEPNWLYDERRQIKTAMQQSTLEEQIQQHDRIIPVGNEPDRTLLVDVPLADVIDAGTSDVAIDAEGTGNRMADIPLDEDGATTHRSNSNRNTSRSNSNINTSRSHPGPAAPRIRDGMTLDNNGVLMVPCRRWLRKIICSPCYFLKTCVTVENLIGFMSLICLSAFALIRFHLPDYLEDYAKYFSYRGWPRGETDSPFDGKFTFCKYPPDLCYFLATLGIDFGLWWILATVPRLFNSSGNLNGARGIATGIDGGMKTATVPNLGYGGDPNGYEATVILSPIRPSAPYLNSINGNQLVFGSSDNMNDNLNDMNRSDDGECSVGGTSVRSGNSITETTPANSTTNINTTNYGPGSTNAGYGPRYTLGNDKGQPLLVGDDQLHSRGNADDHLPAMFAAPSPLRINYEDSPVLALPLTPHTENTGASSIAEAEGGSSGWNMMRSGGAFFQRSRGSSNERNAANPMAGMWFYNCFIAEVIYIVLAAIGGVIYSIIYSILNCIYHVYQLWRSFGRLLIRGQEFLVTFGSVPLFFYQMHYIVLSVASVTMRTLYPKQTIPLVWVFLPWILTILLLKKPCGWYCKFKRSTDKDSLWRMF